MMILNTNNNDNDYRLSHSTLSTAAIATPTEKDIAMSVVSKVAGGAGGRRSKLSCKAWNGKMDLIQYGNFTMYSCYIRPINSINAYTMHHQYKQVHAI
jgi:hypothetical protein